MSQNDVSSWLPNLLGPLDLQANGQPINIPRRQTINLVGLTATDDPTNQATIIAAAVASVAVAAPITSTGGTAPTIGIRAATDSLSGSMSAADKTALDALVAGTVTATTNYSPATVAPLTCSTTSSPIANAQTTSGAHTSVLVSTIPLPGTAGAPCLTGQIDYEYDLAVTGTTTAVAARYKGKVSYTVQTSGSPVALAASVQYIAEGTNSGAVPASWTAVLSLDGTSKNILLKITTDASDTYSASALQQIRYTQ